MSLRLWSKCTWAALAVVVGLGLAACGGSSHSLQGTVTVRELVGTSRVIGGECAGYEGYSDIHAGTAVVVKDESGKVLATGSLSDGKVLNIGNCQFTFKVDGLSDAKFYQVEVSHRGIVTYSRDDLDKASWKVGLTVGS